MKIARLDILIPKSCYYCPLVHSIGDKFKYCFELDKNGYTRNVSHCKKVRHIDCPLKIVETQNNYDSEICKNCAQEIECLQSNGWKKCDRFK